MSDIHFPIEATHVSLRPFERGDLEEVARYHLLPGLQRYMVRATRYPDEVADALNVMRRQVELQRPGDVLTLAIVRRGDQALVGQISLHWYDASARQGEVRFAINPSFSGQGYLTEAIRTIFDLAFGTFDIHRIVVRCDSKSNHTVKLLQKLGMRLEAHYREHALFQGEWDEEMHFAMLEREWHPATKIIPLPVRNSLRDLPKAAN